MQGVCVCIERVCRLCEAAADARGDDVYSFRTLCAATPQNHMLGALQHILCPMTIPGRCIQIQSGAAITTLIGLVRPVPCAESYVHIQNRACNAELSWPGAHLVHIHGNQMWADPHLRGAAYKHTYYSNFGREMCHIPTNRSLRRQPRPPQPGDLTGLSHTVLGGAQKVFTGATGMQNSPVAHAVDRGAPL